MQQFFLSPGLTFLIDVFAWFCFHMGISWLMLQISDQFFVEKSHWFETKKWERQGEIWQKLFSIRLWKSYLPDGTAFLKQGYNKRGLKDSSAETLEKLLLEMRRAEMTHWLSILPAFLFFIWNPPWAGWVMVVYALFMNLPFIITQRYNRPRLEHLRALQERRNREEEKRALQTGH